MRVPDELLDCVGFLGVEDNGRYHLGGTGFFVSLPADRIPDLKHVYFVTARHVVEKANQFGGDMILRLNTPSGVEHLSLRGAEWQWPDHEGPDVALTAFAPPGQFQVKNIPMQMAATHEYGEPVGTVGIGTDLYVIGLFTERHGLNRNLPIVRQGTLAAMPLEPLVDENTGQQYDAYLAEVRSIGGLSGSPVFAMVPGQPGQPSMAFITAYLLGLIRGHWDARGPMPAGVDFLGDDLGPVNMGIAIVTPVAEIEAILERKELVKARRRGEDDYLKSHPITEDSALPSRGEGFTRDDFLRDLTKVTRRVEPESDQAEGEK